MGTTGIRLHVDIGNNHQSSPYVIHYVSSLVIQWSLTVWPEAGRRSMKRMSRIRASLKIILQPPPRPGSPQHRPPSSRHSRHGLLEERVPVP